MSRSWPNWPRPPILSWWKGTKPAICPRWVLAASGCRLTAAGLSPAWWPGSAPGRAHPLTAGVPSPPGRRKLARFIQDSARMPVMRRPGSRPQARTPRSSPEPSWPGDSAGGWGKTRRRCQLGGKPLSLWVNQALAPLVKTCWLITNQPLAHLASGPAPHDGFAAFPGPGRRPPHRTLHGPDPLGAGGGGGQPLSDSGPAGRTGDPGQPHLPPGGGLPVPLGPGAFSRSLFRPPAARSYKTFSRPTAAPPVSWRFAGPKFCPNRKFSLWTPKAGVFLTSIPPKT